MTAEISCPSGTFVSVNDLLESRAREFPDSVVVGVPDLDLNFKTYTYRQLNSAANRLANHYSKSGLLSPRARGDTSSTLTVAMLGPSGFEYAVNDLALLKMGFAVLFLSINNSVPALAHLLKTTKASLLLVHPSYAKPAAEAVKAVKSEGFHCSTVSQASKDVWDVESNDDDVPFERALKPEEESSLPAFIIHSSGSTGFPKPIAITHKAACYNFSAHFGLRAYTTLPLFHAHGHSCFWRAIYSNRIVYLYPSELPLTTRNITRVLAKTAEVQGFYAVPYVLKLLAESDEGITLLKRFKLVTYGGAACPDELGDKLVKEHGVNLVSHCGCTEAGQLMTSLRNFETDKDWNYVRSLGPGTKNVADYLIFKPQPDGTYEQIVKDGWPAKVKTNMPDGSYATNDLFVPHPTIPGAWKFVGRLDDTLVHVNGEKTNPNPIELTIKGESPYISEAIVFGAGKPHTGVLLLPTELAKDMTSEELYPLVWPTVELANAAAPIHSRIIPEMLVFLPYATSLPRTDKGSFMRPKTYAQFADLIGQTYAKFDNGEINVPGRKHVRRTISRQELPKFITDTIKDVMGYAPDRTIGEDEDLFALGIDSLKASWIRGVFQRDLDLPRKLPSNLVFENPSVNLLADFLQAMQSKVDNASLNVSYQAKQIQLMTDLVKKYSDFAAVPALTNGVANGTSHQAPGHIILLTGATGSLGAHLLDRFLASSQVSAVYCLCRARDTNDARKRVSESLSTRGLLALEDRKDAEGRVVCLSARLGDEDLGLGKEMYEQVRDKVSIICHNAWAVNFNLGVESFEQEHIRAVYKLLNLAITARHGQPSSFFFSSSVSAVASISGPEAEEIVYQDPSTAQPVGYARSKWISENLCALAQKTRGIRAEVLRIGQMIADTRHGVWNETEAISLIIKSAQTIGALPDLDETLSWLPVDIAGQACVELALAPARPPSSSSEGTVWHVINPDKSTTWSSILRSLRTAGLEFEVVPRREWIRRLRESDQDPVKNPTIKLLSFFENKYDHERPNTRPTLLTKGTVKASPAIANAGPIGDEQVKLFVDAWRKTGFLV